MARTRNASYRDDGELLGKGGVPLSQAGVPVPAKMDGHAVVHGPGAAPAKLTPITEYRSDITTWARSMDAWTLARLIDLALRRPEDLGNGLSVTVTADEWMTLPADLRMQFMPVRR